MAVKLASVLSGLLLAACSVVGVRDGTEEPLHENVATLGPVEIRRYAARIAAETTIPGDETSARGEGFRRLASYIFGGNQRRTSIAMTAPVAQGQSIDMTAPVAQGRSAAGWTIRFFMPARFTLETLPIPNDPAVRLVPVPSETVAVLRFSGSTGPEAVAHQQQALLQALTGTTWAPLGTPFAWFYDPPWTIPFLHRNEVAVRVEPQS
jgi:hypothetical protein